MATVKVKNTTNFARTGVVTCGIPFSKGFNLQPGDFLVVNNALTGFTDQKVQWYPQGARWDSGAVKYARATFKVDLGALEEKTVTVSRSSTYNAIPFTINNSIVTGVPGTSVGLYLQNIPEWMGTWEILNSAHLIEGGGPEDHYARYKWFSHYNQSEPSVDPQRKYFWNDIVFDVYSGMDFLQFFIRFGFYRFFPNLTVPNGVDPVYTLTSAPKLGIYNARSKIRWEEYKIPVVNRWNSGGNVGAEYTLISIADTANKQQKFAAGMSHCYKGVFAYGSSSTEEAELVDPILAMAEDWATSYPITGVMPSTPSYITSASDALNRSNILLNVLQNPIKAIAHAYNWPTTCNKPNTGFTASHGIRDYAFGLRGWPFLSTTNYNWIPMMEFTTRQQATKTNWFYGDDGNPIPPATLNSNQAYIWNGTYFFLNNNARCGYTRGLTTSDVPNAAQQGFTNAGEIYGPDKEHFTNKMFILQGLVTMDWFSLEYAKMYSKWWIYANNQNGPGSIPSWGPSRATGRLLEVAAFLYEFGGDLELKNYVKTVIGNLIPATGSFLLNTTAFPGTPDTTVRAANVYNPCIQGACLSVQHLRPWEETHCVLGMFVMAKCLLNENPSDTHGLFLRNAARDIAGSQAFCGYVDFRPTSINNPSNRRAITVVDIDSHTFMSQIGDMAGQQPAVGLSSGAQGTIYLCQTDAEYLGQGSTRIYLKNCTGQFTAGETFRLATGHTATVHTVWTLIGNQARATESPINGWGRQLAEPEYEVLIPNAHPDTPVGITKYLTLYHANNDTHAGPMMVAREAAREGYYGSSSTLVFNITSNILDNWINSTMYTDNGDFNESLLRYVGYFHPNLLSNSISISPSTLEFRASAPAPTTSIANQIVTVTPSSIDITLSTSSVLISITSASVVVTPTPNLLTLSTQTVSVSASAVITATSNTLTLATQSVAYIQTVNESPGIRVTKYIEIGPRGSDQTFETENNETPSTGSPSGGILISFEGEHVIRLLTPLGVPVVDYVLVTPLYPNPPLLGEAIPQTGQVLRPQGYTWYVGSEGTDPLEETEYQASVEAGHKEVIGYSSKASKITSWTSTISGTEYEWLNTYDFTKAINQFEYLDIIHLSERKVFQPSFGGAIRWPLATPIDETFPSPSKLKMVKELHKGVLKMEGAVIPLEYDSFGLTNSFQNHGGSSTVPAIAKDMVMYNCIGVNAGGAGVHEIVAWSFHQNGIAAASHNRLYHSLEINLLPEFVKLYAYDIQLGFLTDISYMLATEMFTAEAMTSMARVSGTENNGQVFSTVLPSAIPSGYGAFLLVKDTGICVGLAGKLASTSNLLANANTLVFKNNVQRDATASYKMLGLRSQVHSGFTSEALGRAPGWVGLRGYLLVKDSTESVIAALDALYANGVLDASLKEKALIEYERPAII